MANCEPLHWPTLQAQQTSIKPYRAYESLAPLFPADVRWIVTALNPFTQKPSECRGELEQSLGEIARIGPDLIVAAAPNRTWLEAAIASRFPLVRSVVLGTGSIDPIFANAVRLELRLDVATAFTEVAPADATQLDWENQHRLVDYLVGHKTARSVPAITVPASAQATADQVVIAEGLEKRQWTALFPAGIANVSIKAWPPEKFGQLVATLTKADPEARVMLLGHIREKEILTQVMQAAGALGVTGVRLWLGKDGELPVLAGLLKRASRYVGNDTGAMHIAAAVDTPVVGIFGGGHWPRFRPAARRAVSVVQPLPCFGCNWDCHFGDGPCVKTISVADVEGAIAELASAGNGPIEAVHQSHSLGADSLRLIEAATVSYRRVQGDRIDRQHKIEELKREADTKDTEIGDLKRETDIKDGEIASLKGETNTKDTEIASLKDAANVKDTEIDSLKAETNTKDAEIDSLKAETNTKDAEIDSLKHEANTKDAEIGALKEAANVKDGEIDALKLVCNEREALVMSQDGHIKNFQKIVADLNAALQARAAEREQEVEAFHRRIQELEDARRKVEGIIATLPPDATTWAAALDAKENHIQNIERFLAERDAQIHSLNLQVTSRDQSLANYAAGLTELEQAKHFGRLLAEKESVIQDLHFACVERQKVITQLAAEATGPTRGLRKLWIATSAFFRDRLWQRFDRWLFQRVVEQHWMQIGVLSHYQARPLAWDRKIPKPKLPESRLPKIGLVTPSYQQETFIESTLLSVLNQKYPKLLYVVEDGGSKDSSPAIIAKYADRLHFWESAKDHGQADAVAKGFKRLEHDLGPNDIMAWLNSDDFIAPKVLRYVGEYFATHPHVDVIYGNRIIIDGHDQEVGRWIMPAHDRKALEWIDYVPQETLFWRRKAWDLAGGIDPKFQFALDWDILARFQQAGCTIVRLPYFLGCFRVHALQKTSQAIHTTGADEMTIIRQRFHGARHDNPETIMKYARKTRFRGALNSRLQAWGIRW